MKSPTATPTLSRGAVAVGMVVGVTAVSGAAILIRWADAPALALAFYRCLGGAVALLPFAVRARRGKPPLSRGVRRQLFAGGVFLALHFGLWISSLDFTTVASSVVIVTMAPLFVGLGATWFLRESPSGRTWVAMAAALTGAIVIGVGDATGLRVGGQELFGDLLALGGAVTVAGYLLVGRAVRRQLPIAVYGAAVYGVAAILLGAACVIGGVPLTGFSGTTWLAIAGLIIGPQLLGHTVFNWLLSTVSATVVAIVVLAEPIVATVLALVLLQEAPAGLFWAGAPLILVGVLIATGRRPRRTVRVVPRARRWS